MPRLQTGCPVLLIVAAGLLAGLAAPGGPVDAADPAPHGATAMAEQEAALAGLLAGDVTTPPPGVDPVIWRASVPADNSMTAARVELGRKLYFDTRLSADGSVSCATCHDVKRSFTDLRATSEGIRGQTGKRNSPTTMNAALLQTQFWDGRAATLEEQARLPIVNPIEMGMPDGETAVKAIAGDTAYRRMFQEAYGRPPNYEDIGRAIAAFERTLVFLDSIADDYLRGDEGAVSDEVKRGWVLFNGKARCVSCHPLSLANPLGTDNRFHNIGVSARTQDFEKLARTALVELDKDPSLARLEELTLGSDLSELGRFMVTRNYADIGSFRTPQLRNVAITPPYMHDGSVATLWDVMDHYNRGGEENPYLDGGIEPLGLTEGEITDLVVFLFALTDKRFAAQNDRELTRQYELSLTARPLRDDDLANRRKIPFDPRD